MNAIKVLLIGAHGRTGRHIAQRLHDEAIPFRAFLRKSAHKSEFAALGAEIALSDLTHDFSHVFDDITHVVYAAGSAETEGVHEVIATPLYARPTTRSGAACARSSW